MELPVRMQTSIVWSSMAAAGVGVPGSFGAHWDIPVLIGIWTKLLIKIARLSGEKLEKAKAVKIVTGVTVGIAGLQGGAKLATTYFAWTGVGTVPAIVVNSGANGVLTYLFGRAAARVFLSDDMHDSVTDLVRAIVLLMIGKAPGSPTDV